MAAIDVGGGPGGFAVTLASHGLTVVGVDRLTAMVEAARELAAAVDEPPKFVTGRVECLPLLDAQGDLAVASSLLNVVQDPVRALREMARVTRPGGRVSVLLPGPTLGKEEAVSYCERTGLCLADAALLQLWAGSTRTVPVARARAWFDAVGFRQVACHHVFDALVFTMTGER